MWIALLTLADGTLFLDGLGVLNVDSVTSRVKCVTTIWTAKPYERVDPAVH